MAEIIIKAQPRDEFGKGAARRTRRAGLVPAVMQSHKEAPIHIALPSHDTFLALRHANAVLTIELDGAQVLTVAREVQRNPVTDVLEHVDLQIVKAGEKIEATVRLHIEGEPNSGIALLDLQELAVRAEATAVPEVISISVEGLNDGDSIRVGSLVLPAGVEALEDPETALVTVTAPRAEEAPEGAETGGDEAAEAE
ncbi:MAG: 50S ribosomal protein L25/general stress protein Ctc [Bifidobacteriaceae bacterium]|jgi:large subunit ribosomal protein L25|nr:50S ribosomal protein L25/general stress protein Ctc [Bifidobacteriaceae bacterium]